jgi:ribonuclease BN (tRNA processing enzyme)
LTGPLPIYANREPQELFRSLAFDPYVEPIEISDGTQIELIGARFTFASTVHAIPCLAVSVEYQGKKFTFSADSGPCAALERLAAHADLFVCEASWLEKDRGPESIGHLTTIEAAQLAKRAQVKQLALTHFYPEYDLNLVKQEAEREFGREVQLCRQGSVWNLDREV